MNDEERIVAASKRFTSFEEALTVCMTAENGSGEQDAALLYCLEHAPADLQEVLKARYQEFHAGRHAADCGCGCGQ